MSSHLGLLICEALSFMRLISFRITDYNFLVFRNIVFYSQKFNYLSETGVRTQILSFCSSFFFWKVLRIRGPPSLDLKEILSRKEIKMNTLPKRRRKKDNPYTLLYDSIYNKYYILFKDVRGVLNKIEVSNNIFNVFNRFELDDISELHKVDKHIDMKPLNEEKLYKIDNKSLDDYIIRKSTYLF